MRLENLKYGNTTRIDISDEYEQEEIKHSRKQRDVDSEEWILSSRCEPACKSPATTAPLSEPEPAQRS